MATRSPSLLLSGPAPLQPPLSEGVTQLEAPGLRAGPLQMTLLPFGPRIASRARICGAQQTANRRLGLRAGPGAASPPGRAATGLQICQLPWPPPEGDSSKATNGGVWEKQSTDHDLVLTTGDQCGERENSDQGSLPRTAIEKIHLGPQERGLKNPPLGARGNKWKEPLSVWRLSQASPGCLHTCTQAHR